MSDDVAEQTVEWTAIVEDLERDVSAVSADLVVAGYPAVRALLTISLEPEWPGNVHLYEIMINPCDGTFAGVAHESSNIRGEMIHGAFSADFTDINFTAVYPAPAHHYAWFGVGPLGCFTGMDSRGNPLNTLSGTVTKPAGASYGRTDDAVVEDSQADGSEILVNELPAATTVVEPPLDEIAEVAMPEAPVEVPVVADETPPDETPPEVAPLDETPSEDTPSEDTPLDETPSVDTRGHAVGCQCLPCRWAAFKPVPVTEGPLAGHAFYFGSGGSDPHDGAVTRPE